MLKRALVLAAAIFPYAEGVAQAQEKQGFELGARLGYGIPVGETREGVDITEAISGQFPLWLDVGYRAIPELFVGAYFQYGFGLVGSGLDDFCDLDAIDCSASDIRVGAQVHYHGRPNMSADPWIGLGVGYEWMTIGADSGVEEISTTGGGFEFANVQGGIDFEAAPNVGIGPFVSFSVAQFSSFDTDCTPSTGCGDGGDIEGKGIHGWIVLGVRGDFIL